jgi:hypothetical protein
MDHMALLVGLLAWVVALGVSLVTALVSAIRVPGYVWKSTRHSKSVTIVGILLAGGIGGLYYWLVVRDPVHEALRHTVPPERPPKPIRPDPWADDAW